MAETVQRGPADESSGSIITNPDGDGGGGGSPYPPGSFTPGSILFANALGQVGEDNPSLFYDVVTKRVGIGTNAPAGSLDVVGNVNLYASALEMFGGGYIKLSTGGILFTDTIQHATFPGGAAPINILVPINVEAGTGENYFGTTGDQGAIFLDAKLGNQKSIGFGWNVNTIDQAWINRTGYQNGFSQFRDLYIGDGKGNIIATFDSQNRSVFVGGSGVAAGESLAVRGGLEVFTASGEEIFFGSNRETFWMGGVGATSMGTNFNTNGAATLFVNDVGYLGGVTQFRSFQVNNGKGATIALFNGATQEIDMATSLLRTGTKILGAQGAAVADAAGGATIDAQARTAINTLLARLRASTGHGLIAG